MFFTIGSWTLFKRSNQVRNNLSRAYKTFNFPLCRWFYNKYKDRCEPFSWGGCLGNMNNFNSNSSCENMCRPRMDTTTIVQPELVSKETSTVDHICSLPSSAGSCDDDETHERFFYDILTEECRKFVYSGCGGNLNNFHSLNECSDFCGQ